MRTQASTTMGDSHRRLAMGKTPKTAETEPHGGNGLMQAKLRAGEWSGFAAALLYLSEVTAKGGSDKNGGKRLSISQLACFCHIALGELDGSPVTFSDLEIIFGDSKRTLHTTYKVFLAPSHNFPHGLDWVRQEENPADRRVQFLRLTDKGSKVIHDTLQALNPRRT